MFLRFLQKTSFLLILILSLGAWYLFVIKEKSCDSPIQYKIGSFDNRFGISQENFLKDVDKAGKIRTVAGTGKKSFSGDGGDALKAGMNGPKHLYPDRQDNILIADAENNVVRKYIPATRKIVRVAGTDRKGTALNADPLKTELARPHGVYVHTDGVIYIVDSYNSRVLKIAP